MATALKDKPIETTGERPYPNEHAARLINPDDFDEFRRKNNAGGEGVDFIFGIKGDDPVKLQSIRFKASDFTIGQAKEWLRNNKYHAILFEPATNVQKSMENIDLRSINKELLRREATIEICINTGSEDEEEEDVEVGLEDETVEGEGEAKPVVTRAASDNLTFSFSSEAPVDRWWGREVLVHDEDSMDLTRMNDGAPWLWNHNRDVVLGVSEKTWLGPDKRLYTTVKWSPNTNEPGTEEYKRRKDIEAGIVRNVSFAYEIGDIKESPSGDMLVTRWNVLEVSSVSVPADQSVGLGRSLADSAIEPDAVKVVNEQLAERETEEQPVPPTMEQTIDIKEVQSAARAAERDRVATIRSMCDQHGVGADLADQLIDNDATIDQAREAVLTQLGRTKKEFQGRVHDAGDGAIGMTDSEVKRYSLLKVIRHLADPSDRAAREEASFELECSKAAEKKLGRAARGVVMPWDVMSAPSERSQNAGTGAAGGFLVPTELLTGSFIELVRNRSAILGLNVTTLTGLMGNVDIPKQIGPTTAYWVGEDQSLTETQVTLGQLSMTPKSLGGYVDITRRLMLQSSMNVEELVRSDLARSMALAIDYSAIYGLGGSSQLLGIKNVTGVGAQTLSSNPDTDKQIGGVTYRFGKFVDYVNMETLVSAANLDVASMYYVGNAYVRGALKVTQRNLTYGERFVWEDDIVNGYSARVSNQLIGSNVLFGDFSQAVFGFWSGVDITVDPYTQSTKGTTRIVAFQDVDFGLRNPAAFVFGSGQA